MLFGSIWFCRKFTIALNCHVIKGYSRECCREFVQSNKNKCKDNFLELHKCELSLYFHHKHKHGLHSYWILKIDQFGNLQTLHLSNAYNVCRFISIIVMFLSFLHLLHAFCFIHLFGSTGFILHFFNCLSHSFLDEQKKRRYSVLTNLSFETFVRKCRFMFCLQYFFCIFFLSLIYFSSFMVFLFQFRCIFFSFLLIQWFTNSISFSIAFALTKPLCR